MAKCPDPANAQLALAQTLQTGLAAATPPARWQADHDQLKKAVAGVIGLLSTQLAAAAAQDVQGFLGSSDLIRTYGPLFCDPIKHINAGPPPLTPKLDPLDLMFCAGGE